jgi:GNAT superfamily N-acetyltransferase
MAASSVVFKHSILTTETWPYLLKLFGEKGACGGCWCMTPRLPPSVYNKHKGEGNKKLFVKLIQSQEPLGVIGFAGETPISWCSFSPKDRLLQMRNSRIMQSTTDADVWSIVCLFVEKEYRRKGISSKIISAAADYAFSQGAKIVEAYHVVSRSGKMPDAFAWNGIWSSYKKAGFTEVKKLSDTRLIMQLKRS